MIWISCHNAAFSVWWGFIRNLHTKCSINTFKSLKKANEDHLSLTILCLRVIKNHWTCYIKHHMLTYLKGNYIFICSITIVWFRLQTWNKSNQRTTHLEAMDSEERASNRISIQIPTHKGSFYGGTKECWLYLLHIHQKQLSIFEDIFENQYGIPPLNFNPQFILPQGALYSEAGFCLARLEMFSADWIRMWTSEYSFWYIHKTQ